MKLDPSPETTIDEFLQKHGKKYVTYSGLSKLLDQLLDGLGPALKEQRRRIQQLESRPMMKWAGVHVPGMQYGEASLVTKSGSLWAAMTTTTTTPGESNSDWRLIVKRGKA